jgi:mannose-6-phosphate isomerase-like protein (cupin superfamily)
MHNISGVVVRAGNGRPLTEEPAAMRLKIGSELTDGRWSLLEGLTRPGAQSLLHRHEQGTKAFYVLHGSYELFCSGEWSDLNAGDAITIPAGAVHGFRAGPNGGRALVIYPGRQERWFIEVAQAGGHAALDSATIASISHAHGVTQLGPLPTR